MTQRFGRFGLAIAMLAAGAQARPALAAASNTPIQHVIIIMQENRSFENYFGTFPGARGFLPQTCEPLDPKNPAAGCVKPFHDPHAVNADSPHSWQNAQVDLDDGITTTKFDGFAKSQNANIANQCVQPTAASCLLSYDGAHRHDTMGFHDDREIYNYWQYAKNFVLQDHMFTGERSWSLASHTDLASEWTATCTDYTDASTCLTYPNTARPAPNTQYPWANLFQLLDVHSVSWKYYIGQGPEPDCNDAQFTCDPEIPLAVVNPLWNMPPYFSYVKAQGSAYLAAHNPQIDQFLVDLKQGTLPQVSWIVPASTFSEHPPTEMTAGMEYVTSLVNAVMQSPYWNSTAIYISWDDWGGFYDDVAPPNVDMSYDGAYVEGFGIRVPGLMISAYARKGVVDHQVLSFENYATLFENLFMGGARLDPTALGNPDSRPDLRDAVTQVSFPDGSTAIVGDLLKEFDFTQSPLPPVILNTHTPTLIRLTCRTLTNDHEKACTKPTVRISFEPVTGPQIPGPFTYHLLRDGVDLPKCTGTNTVCVDTPPSGNHLYTVYSVDPNGVVSPTSAAAEADEP